MKTQFDKIYVISLITNKERQDFIKYQFNQLGLDFEFIYGIDYYNFVDITWPNVYINTYDKNLPGTAKSYGCAITHYQAVMQAYYLGYNNVLIFEDDVCLNKDINLWEYMLNNIPNNIDFIEYDPRSRDDNNREKIVKLINESKERYVNADNNYKIYGAAMFALLNRNVMNIYLNNQHKCFVQSDWVNGFWENIIVNRYIPTKCLFIDQVNYHKKFIQNNNKLYHFEENILLRFNKYNKDNFFKPDIFHLYSRY